MSCKKLQIIAVAVSAILLSACGNSGGGGVAGSRDSSVVSGVAHDAPLLQAPVRIYAWDNGTKGDLLGTSTTDDKGDYQIELTSADRPILIEAGGGGRYIEEASGVRVELASNQYMRAVAQYRSGQPITVQTTPLSTIAACFADYLVSRGNRVEESINLANAKFSAIYGVEVIADKPIDVTDPANTGFALSDGFKYGFITAGISQFMATEVSEANGLTPHGASFATSINWSTVACGDIKADGRLNGFGYSGAGSTLTNLSFGSYAITPQVYRTFIAQRILTFVASDRNQTTLPVNAGMVTFANGLSTSTDDVWDGQPADPVDNTGPAITAIIAENTALSGTTSIGFSISDPVGVDSIQFFIDNNLVSIGQIENPQLAVDTQFYLDGEHTIKVVATDIIGNETTEEVNYRFWNSGPAITMTSEAKVGNSTYSMTGTYNSPVANISTVNINLPNGTNVANAVLSNGTWSAELTLSNGNNDLVVDATDTLGNTSSLDVTVAVDMNAPTILPWDNSVRFTTYEGQYNLCQFGDLTLTSGEDTPVCLRSDRVSLNGASVNSNLENLEYILMSVRVADSVGAGVFTEISDLSADYRYEQNGTEVIGWTPLTTRGSNSSIDFFYLPLVTEYFGNTFHQSATDTVHNVTIRVSDNVGNTSQVKYKIKLDVLVPALSMNLVENTEILFNIPFASRAAIDNNSLIQTTSFENIMGTPVYIDPSPRTGSYATHRIESMQRVNKVRIKETDRLIINGANRSGATVYYNTVPSQRFQRVSFTARPGVRYQGWQSPFSDTLPILPRKSLMTAPNGIPYCSERNAEQYGSATWYNFVVPGVVWGCTEGGNMGVVYDRTQSLDYAVGDAICPSGYPCNPSTFEETNYNISTGTITVRVDGVPATIINGRYVIPAGSTASIENEVRMPNILHFNDSVVLTPSVVSDYNNYEYDKSTDWYVDMRIDLAIAGSAESTPNVQVIGSVINKTIER